MTIGAAAGGAQSPAARRAVSSRGVVAVRCSCLLCSALLTACQNFQITGSPERITVAQGEPSIGTAGGTIQQRQAPSPGDYTETNPFQVDMFSQQATAKVDVLWMIDNSGSMAPKQAKVKADFQAFIQQLTTPGANQEVVDYHIGVVTTDTYDPSQSGKLQNPGHLSKPWIGNYDTCLASASCDPVAEFQTMASVGTIGSGDEKGLLAAEMALTPPLVDMDNAGFMRPEASIAIIMVSDEDDSSCEPIQQNTEGCLESAIGADPNGYGDIAFYGRLFRELKGYGNEQYVSLSAFVGDSEDVTIPASGDGLSAGLKGCLVQGADASQPFSYAVYAPRYIGVANAAAGLPSTYAPDSMGSPVHSICAGDFSAAVQTIGKYATLQKTFYLSRKPADPTMIQGCVDSCCSDCGSSSSCGTTCTYNPETASPPNTVTFTPVPPAGSTITISYKVQAN
jgi:hypothetical protein